MKPYIATALPLLIFGELALGQPQKNVSQNTGGECSPAIVSEGKVTITCTGLDRRQQETLRKIPTLMDQLLKRSQSDRDQLLAKLDEILKLQKDAEARNATEIANAVVEKTKIRNLFAREMKKPVMGMYAIISLSKPLTVDRLSDIAGVIEIVDTLDENRPCLFLGVRPDMQEWTEIPGNRKILMNGIRSEVWTFSRQSKPETKPLIIDSFFAYSFDFIDRLEVGAMMDTPFKTVGQLDHAVVLFRSSRGLLDYIDRVTLVVNDYVVFEIKKADIINWSIPSPPMIGKVVYGRVDESSGKLVDQKIVKTMPLDPNFMMPNGFREVPFFTAFFSSSRAQNPPPMNNATVINMVDTNIRIQHIMGGLFLHHAGNGDMTILPGQHGWLPKEDQ